MSVTLNGAELWPGTEWHHDLGTDTWSITPPGGVEQILHPGDILVIGGIVKTGPLTGKKFEIRPVGQGLQREIFYEGHHGENCELTEDGWICRGSCSAVDVPQEPLYENLIDTLIDILPKTKRRWLRVHWTLSRRSHQQRFTNGRSRQPEDEVVSIAVWHEGKTWTKRAAQRKMDALSTPPDDE